MEINNKTIFSTNLKTLRKKQDVTQEQLANYLGVSPQAVSKWENGNYPEGDLLPKISDYFGVSISFLYGQEKQKVSIEQELLDLFQGIAQKHIDDGKPGNYNPEYFDKMLDIIWAFQIGAWKNNKEYYKKVIPDKSARTASVITDDAGFGFFNLNLDNQFYTLGRDTKEGFFENLKEIDDAREMFEVLGKEGAIRIIYYLLALNGNEYVTIATIAQDTGLDIERCKALMDEIGTFQTKYNACFKHIDVKIKDGVEDAYGINQAVASLYIALLMNMKVLLDTPDGFHMQIGCRTKSWFDMGEVKKHFKETIKQNKSKK